MTSSGDGAKRLIGKFFPFRLLTVIPRLWCHAMVAPGWHPVAHETRRDETKRAGPAGLLKWVRHGRGDGGEAER